MAFDAEFQTWWDRLSEANRTRLKTAAGDDVLRRATTRLLLQTARPWAPSEPGGETPIGPDAGVPARDRVELAGAGAPIRAVALNRRW